MNRLLFLIALALPACVATPKPRDPVAIRFEGVVTDSQASPLAGARVRAVSLNTDNYGVTIRGETLTDASGRFSLSATAAPDFLQISRGKLSAIVQKPEPGDSIKVVATKRKD